ncbi:MAG: XdhC family protein [Pseudomonadota bacterium]
MTDPLRAPMAGQDVEQVPEAALGWVRGGKRAALATLIEIWGSAPRRPGAQLAVNALGEMVGSVSGGCVEGAVVTEAMAVLEDGRPRVLDFTVSSADAFAVGLSCGGQMRVLIEPVGQGAGIPEALLADLVAARSRRRPVVYAVNPETWERHLMAATAPGPLQSAVQAALRADRSSFYGDWFLCVNTSPLKLAVVGAVHIAQALAPMARIAGYEVAVIDPRSAFATAARFPQTRLLHEWPDVGLATFGLDDRTAVVSLTHDPKLDGPAIRAALRAPVFYLGCLGSRKTHAARIAWLERDGYTPEDIARIHAPIGADIGASSPAEIAVSILAQMIECLRKPETQPQIRAMQPA